MTWLILASVAFLAFWNGANDNPKGVATIYGAGVASYRASLAWATATTFAGSLLSIVFARGLIHTFSGQGLVSDTMVGAKVMPAAVSLAALITVMLATLVGMPVSTTHALTGGLMGAGLMAAGSVDLGVLGTKFLIPLLLGPTIAIIVVGSIYPVAHRIRQELKVKRETCLCIGGKWHPVGLGETAVASAIPALSVTTGEWSECQERYTGAVLGVQVQPTVNLLHFVSAGAVGFARGLNDTPKMVALLVAGHGLSSLEAVVAVAIAIAFGAILAARRVAETMAKKITPLTPGQGVVSNVSSAAIVIGASRYGLPVSTTHVTNGGIFAVGAVSRSARWRLILAIVSAWVATLPLACVLGMGAYVLFDGLGLP